MNVGDAQRLLEEAGNALRQGDWNRLADRSDRLIRMHPRHPGAHYLRGIAALELQQHRPAVDHLGQAVVLAPQEAPFAAAYARALATARRDQDALVMAERAFALAPRDPGTLDLIGQVFSHSMAHEKAAQAYRSACALAPAHAAHRYNLVTALIALGDVDAAELELERCLAIDPLFWRAHLTSAHLRRRSETDNHVERLAALLSRHAGDPLPAICLNLALAKEYEDLGRYAEAFDHLTRGKAASRRAIRYDPDQDARLIDAMIRAFPTQAAASTAHPSDAPIFVFGMPRTGTTLVERILASHPQVRSAGELQAFGMAVRQAWGTHQSFADDPDIAEHVAALDGNFIGERYLSLAGNPGDGRRFVDKFPQNFLYAGFIARAFPQASLICLRRHPLDTCLSNFRELFAEKLPYYHYSFDLLDTGRYYIGFDRLMAHWREVMPGRILELDYESLVAEPEATTRELLAHCRLPWDARCLAFDRNEAPVATASALQVRRPIYRDSVGRWRHYAAELAPLKTLLTRAGIEVAP